MRRTVRIAFSLVLLSHAAGAAAQGPPAVQTKESQAAMTPRAALERLQEGNRRFAANATRQRDWSAKVAATASGQFPFAAVLGCMDSRAPSEILFDQALGDVFGVRVAGNVVNEDGLGSLEYAVEVGAKLIVVLGHTDQGREIMKEAIEDTGRHVVHELERFLGTLGTIAAVSPLLGLLGTVTGMIQAFEAISAEGVGDPQVLAGGIGTALITTAAGLIVAIPAVIAYNYFTGRVQAMMLQVTGHVARLAPFISRAREERRALQEA